jgi:hypothetical protein
VQQLKTGVPHLSTAIDPGNWDLLDVITGEHWLETGLHISCEVMFRDLETSQDIGAVQFQVIRDVAHAHRQEKSDQCVNAAIA